VSLFLDLIRHGYHRGFFSETYKQSIKDDAGISVRWIQVNHSFSSTRVVVRGSNFESGISARVKLHIVTRGAILDVVVDIRKSSPAFSKHVAVELSTANWRQLLVPVGFAHGFCTLSEEREVLCKVLSEYDQQAEGRPLWRDPTLGSNWSMDQVEATLSARDCKWPVLQDLELPFRAGFSQLISIDC
jgi:dTDP-4-dehydrorhamnose 3,5-epimerase